MGQTSLNFSKIPIELAIELAFQQGQAYQDLYTKGDLSNAINFDDIQHAKSCGAQFKLKGTMENLPSILGVKTDKQIIILKEMEKLIKSKRDLIKICIG